MVSARYTAPQPLFIYMERGYFKFLSVRIRVIRVVRVLFFLQSILISNSRYLNQMKKQDWGRIVFISSESAVHIPA